MSSVLQAFAEGALNPILLPDQALALVALGLFIGRQQQGRGVTLLVFAAAVAAGLFAIALAVGPTPARNVLLAVAAIVGLLVAAGWAPPPLGWPLAAIAGVALGLDSPPQAITLAQANAALIGTALGACGLLLGVALCAGLAKQWWQQVGVRVLGSWIAASAILVLAVMLK